MQLAMNLVALLQKGLVAFPLAVHVRAGQPMQRLKLRVAHCSASEHVSALWCKLFLIVLVLLRSSDAKPAPSYGGGRRRDGRPTGSNVCLNTFKRLNRLNPAPSYWGGKGEAGRSTGTNVRLNTFKRLNQFKPSSTPQGDAPAKSWHCP